MALRFLLVGLVVALGFELPGDLDVSGWAKAGRDWVQARIALARGESTDRQVAEADEAFAGIVEEMAGRFSADASPADESRRALASATPAAEGRFAGAVRLTGEAATAWFSLAKGAGGAALVR